MLGFAEDFIKGVAFVAVMVAYSRLIMFHLRSTGRGAPSPALIVFRRRWGHLWPSDSRP